MTLEKIVGKSSRKGGITRFVTATIAAGLFTFGYWLVSRPAIPAQSYILVEYHFGWDKFGYGVKTETVTPKRYQEMLDENHAEKGGAYPSLKIVGASEEPVDRTFIYRSRYSGGN